MTVKRILNWTINSLNQERQEVLRSIDGGPDTVIATLSATDTSYVDSEEFAMTTGVTYQVASIATIKGVEVKQVSAPVEEVVPPPAPMSIMTTGNELQVLAYSPITVSVENGPTVTPNAEFLGDQLVYRLTHAITDSLPQLVNIQSVEPTNPITAITFEKGVDKVLSWNEAGHNSIVVSGTSLGSINRLSPTITQVPATLHPSITNLNNMFANAATFNQDISGWDVSAVTSMNGTFSWATAFNQDISGWNTTQVTSMSHMFAGTNAFNQPIGGWDTSKVTSMASMFDAAKAFNQPIGTWDTSSVVRMDSMFQSAKVFNQDLSGWNVSNVIDMSSMFSYSVAFNGSLTGWNTVKVGNMSYMFYGAKAFNQPIGGWNVSNVTLMPYLFASNPVFNQPLNGWDVSRVTDMSYMFSASPTFDQDLDLWNVKSVSNMSRMFKGTTYPDRHNLSQWCVASISSAPTEFCPKNWSTQNWPVWGTCPRGENLV